MEGIEVNLDTGIGKWLSKLADTVTRLAETQNITEVQFQFLRHLVFNFKYKKPFNLLDFYYW